MLETPTAGFVAQELDEAQTKANAEWLNLVLKSNPEKLEATYGNLLPVIVKAIQDLKKENDELKEQLITSAPVIIKSEEDKTIEEQKKTIEAQQEELNALKEEVAKIEEELSLKKFTTASK